MNNLQNQNLRLINLLAAKGPLEFQVLQGASMEVVAPQDEYEYDPSDEADLERIASRGKGEHAVYSSERIDQDFDREEFDTLGRNESIPYIG